jgi:glycosyltransferase involved in cell wall biosynthesis
MRVVLVAFANKYTGAAAVAEHCCRALRTVGVDARMIFVAGRNLEQRLSAEAWAEAGLVKERTPLRAWRNLGTLRRIAADADAVICHLPHDHALCVAAGLHTSSALVRAFRNPGHLRLDPWHRFVARRLTGVTLANRAMLPQLHRCHGSLPHLVLQVPLEDRFRPGPDGAVWRQRLSIPEAEPVLGMVGKLAAGRGFGFLLKSAALVDPPCRVLAVGHGESQPSLERRAAELGLTGRVHWAGYQEAALPELYSAMDAVAFIAPGSDHGHRAISEAQACGRPVVALAVAGVEDLIEHGATGLIAERTPESLASAISEVLGRPETARRLGSAAAASIADRRFRPSGERLANFLEEIVATKKSDHRQ